MIIDTEGLSYFFIFALWFLVGLSSYYFLKKFSTGTAMTTVDGADKVSKETRDEAKMNQQKSFFHQLLRSCKNETLEPITGKATGEIPSWLEGSLIRNGPGLMEVGPDKYQHAFDGLALIHRFFIKNGTATYQNAFLRSKSYNQNMRANRIVVTEFGTVAFPDPCLTIFERLMSFFKTKEFTDNDNVSIVKIGDEYYAATETSLIHKIDSETLETKDRVDISKFLSVNTATAHPHYEEDGTLINMGSQFNLGRPKYCLIKFPPKTEQKSSFEAASIVCSIPSSRALSPSYYHSFAMTTNHYIFIEQSLVLSLSKLARSLVTSTNYSSALTWCPDEMVRFHVVKKDSGEILPLHLIADPFMLFHQVNAYEEGDTLVLDMCCYEDGKIVEALYTSYLEKSLHPNPEIQNQAKPVDSQIRRYILPLNIDQFNDSKEEPKRISFPGSKASALLQSDNSILCLPEELTKDFEMVELPRINYEKYNGKKYDYFYGICRNGNDNGLIKGDLKTGKHIMWKKENLVPSEPIFVPSPNGIAEDDGVVLSSLLHSDDETKVTLLINDGKTFQEIASVEFTTTSAVPNDFHGIFI